MTSTQENNVIEQEIKNKTMSTRGKGLYCIGSMDGITYMYRMEDGSMQIDNGIPWKK